jgi:hypothetical protein
MKFRRGSSPHLLLVLKIKRLATDSKNLELLEYPCSRSLPVTAQEAPAVDVGP